MTQDEGRAIESTAAALLCKRDGEGHLLLNAQGKPEYISADAAKGLLQEVKVTPASQGSYMLHVPVDAIVNTKLVGAWNRMEFPRVALRGRSHYEVDSVLSQAILAKLEFAAGCTFKDAQALPARGR